MAEKRDNTVFVGKKESMAYVLAVVTQFNQNHGDIHIKARGRAISKAVDVAEIVRNRFVKEAQVKNITIGTEQLETEEKQKINVSTIELILGR